MFSIGVARPETQFVGYVKWDEFTRFIRLDEEHGATAGVFLFFLVSGYIVSQVAAVERRMTFLAKRAARLLPAMVIGIGLAIVVGMTLHAIGRPTWYLFNPDHALTWRSILEALGFGVVRPIEVLFPLWTLAVEYWWYFLLFVLMWFCRTRPVLGAILMQLALVLLFWVAPVVSAGSFGLERAWMVPVGVVLIGRWVYLVRCGLGLIPGVAGALSALGIYVALNLAMPGATTETLISSSLTVIWASAIFCCLLAVLHGPLRRPVNLMAEISYGMYLYHIPIAWVLLTTFVPTGGPWMLPVVLLSLAVTVGFGLLSHTFVEKPIRNAMRRRLGNRPQPTIVV